MIVSIMSVVLLMFATTTATATSITRLEPTVSSTPQCGLFGFEPPQGVYTTQGLGLKFNISVCGVVDDPLCPAAVCAYDGVSGKYLSALALWSDVSTTWQVRPVMSGSVDHGMVSVSDNSLPCPGFPNITATVRVFYSCFTSPVPSRLVSVTQGDGACDFVFTVPSPNMVGCTNELMFYPCQSGPFYMGGLNSTSGPYFARGSDGFIYKINVCGPVRDGSECQSLDGMLCKYDSTGAKFIDALSIWDGGFGMSWTSGVLEDTFTVEAYTMNGITSCDSTGRPARVLWRFVCGRVQTFAVNVDSTGCLYTVVVNTPLACPK
jgi:hypothetical protein